MKDFSTRSVISTQENLPTIPQRDTEAPSYLITRPQRESNVIKWWYRLTAPAEPGSTATFKDVERFRRGRAGSNIILALYLLLIISIPAQFVGTASYLIPIVIGSAIALAVGVVF